MSISFLFALSILFAGCNNSSSEVSSDAYFGGHIVNPESNHIIITRDSNHYDSIFLSDNSDFSHLFEDVEAGFYTVRHGHESQIIYLSPGDSLLTWVNTLEFDESLHFSGRGAEKNNFLVNLNLWNEQNTELILNYHENSPPAFEAKMDSIREQRLQRLAELEEKQVAPEEFLDTTKKMIDYELYDLRERYTYMITKYYREYADEFPDDFYAYRTQVDFDEESLKSNPAYLRFLENYLINQSMSDCKSLPRDNDCYNTNAHENIVKRVELVDSLSNTSEIKNYFYYRLGALGIVMAKDRRETVKVLQLLREKDLPREQYSRLVTLGNLQLAFLPGTNIGSIHLRNSQNELVEASKVFRRRSLVYLWSIHAIEHHKEQHQIIEDLRKKYKNIDFLGINVDVGETLAWQNTLHKYNYPADKEFQLGEVEIAGEPLDSDLLRSYLDKLLFLNPSGEVVIGDAYLNSPDFESRILEFLNL